MLASLSSMARRTNSEAVRSSSLEASFRARHSSLGSRSVSRTSRFDHRIGLMLLDGMGAALTCWTAASLMDRECFGCRPGTAGAGETGLFAASGALSDSRCRAHSRVYSVIFCASDDTLRGPSDASSTYSLVPKGSPRGCGGLPSLVRRWASVRHILEPGFLLAASL